MQSTTNSNQVVPGGGQEEPIAGATGTAVSSSRGGTGANANGGRFDFDDGGTYCGGWEDGKAHGHGVCTGPKGQGAYSGSWHYGFEVSGVYTWPSGSAFEGQWQNGKRHGLGVETRGRWIYRGEWTQGFKGRYGVRQSNTSTAKYEGTWANGLQDGYGSETYADDGTYQGQWLRGMRHGYGVRSSAPFGKASKYRANKANLRASQTSLRSTDQPPSGGNASGPPELNEQRDRRVNDSRGGFVLKTNSNEPVAGVAGAGGRRRSIGGGNFRKKLMGITLTKQKSTSELEKGHVSGSVHSTLSSASWRSTDSAQSAMTNASLPSDSNASFVVEDEQMDPSTTETYMGEWKNDKRTGFGVSERSDGLKYEGEWYNNKKYGYGVTTLANGEKEEGKYKNNVLITNPKKKHLFLMRSAKFRERIDAAVSAAQRASKIAMQKADIAISRTATARGKAEQADRYAAEAQNDSSLADAVAKQYAPDFKQPGLDYRHHRQNAKQRFPDPFKDITPPNPIVPNAIHHPHQHNNPHQQAPPSIQVNSQHQQQQMMGNHMKLPQPNTQMMQNQQNLRGSSYQLNQQQNPATGLQQSNSIMNQQQRLPNNPSMSITPNNPSGGGLNQHQQSSIDAIAASASNVAAGTLLANDLSNQMLQQGAPDPSPRRGRPSLSSLEQSQINRALQQQFGGGNRRVSGDNRAPHLATTGQQSSIDHFDHYKRPPSRDSSVDRYSRATGRMGGNVGQQSNSRQASIDRSSGAPNNPTQAPTQQQQPMTNNSNNPSATFLRASVTPERSARAASAVRGTTPAPQGTTTTTTMPSNGTTAPPTRNGSVLTGNGMSTAGGIPATPPFEDILLKKRNLGQDIIPSLNQPKRTESLYMAGSPVGGVGPAAQAAKTVVSATTLQRKKSLPEFQELPKKTEAMTREEVSALGSARREEVRRMADEKERLRANPLLWLVSPQVKDWFSRQQLIIIVLFVNVSLAIMFFKLLT